MYCKSGEGWSKLSQLREYLGTRAYKTQTYEIDLSNLTDARREDVRFILEESCCVIPFAAGMRINAITDFFQMAKHLMHCNRVSCFGFG